MTEKSLTTDQFVALIARHERRVRAFVACFTTNRPDAVDDIIQATYVTAWQKLSSFSYLEATPDEELVRWMCAIARFETLSYLRTQATAPMTLTAEFVDQLGDYQQRIGEVLEARHRALRQCLGRLSRRQQELLQLRYWQGLSIEGIAQRQARRATAVYCALSKTRKALENCITHCLQLEGF